MTGGRSDGCRPIAQPDAGRFSIDRANPESSRGARWGLMRLSPVGQVRAGGPCLTVAWQSVKEHDVTRHFKLQELVVRHRMSGDGSSARDLVLADCHQSLSRWKTSTPRISARARTTVDFRAPNAAHNRNSLHPNIMHIPNPAMATLGDPSLGTASVSGVPRGPGRKATQRARPRMRVSMRA